MVYYLLKLLLIVYVTSNYIHGIVSSTSILKKRQIYREQVLPHSGGRIPDSAFEADRLFLNRLQKDAISVTDGNQFEQRQPNVYPYMNRSSRKILLIGLDPNGRYRVVNDNYLYDGQKRAIETTYLYPQIHGQPDEFITVRMTSPTYQRYDDVINTQYNRNNKLLWPFKKYENSYNAKSYQYFNTWHVTVPQSSSTTKSFDTKTYFSEPNIEHYFAADNALKNSDYFEA